MRKGIVFASFFFVVVMFITGSVFAEQLVTVDQSIKDMLGSAAVTPKTVTLTSEQVKDINAAFSQTLIVTGKNLPAYTYSFYTTKDAGTVIVEKQMGRWGIIQTSLLIGTDGKIKNLEVDSLTEKRGRPVVLRPFLTQFIGKGIGDVIEVGKTINAVSGATVSSKAMAITVKRSLAVYNIVIAKNKAGEK